MRRLSICTITRATVVAILLLMVAMSFTSTQQDRTVTDTTATDTIEPIVRPPSLLETTEPFDVHEQQTRARFATQIAAATSRPDWLGVTLLSERTPNENGQYDTPPALTDRRFITQSKLAPPDDDTFSYTITTASDEVLQRSTWRDTCPISADDLVYVTVTFYGFDQVTHVGELLLHRDVADDIVTVFETLHDAQFPIEEMRIISHDDLAREPTGDGNVTTGFVCRSVVSGNAWSQHAYGRGLDINPFHNPYLRGQKVIPELAGAYLDRNNVRPGMIVANDVVVQAFAAIGWPWGGDWSSAKDWMHFSSTGR